MTIIDDAWMALRQEGRTEQGWHLRRVYTDAKCEIFAGIRQPSAVPGLILEVSREDVPFGLLLPKSKGFSVDPLLLDRSASGRVQFALVLSDRAYETVFSVLCDDTARAAAMAARPQLAIRDWINRLHVWQEFMTRFGIQGLSEEAAIGLHGELLVMRDFVLPLAGAASAVRAWSGPIGEPNDFSLRAGFLEVKTTTRQAPELIQISDADQLDDSRGTIFLAHVKLRPSSAGETLPQVVSDLGAVLIREAADHLERFKQLLMSAGYLDAHAHLYENSYALQAVDFFHVTGSFPRIRRAELPAGIRFITYMIEISACSQQAVNSQALQRLIEDGQR